MLLFLFPKLLCNPIEPRISLVVFIYMTFMLRLCIFSALFFLSLFGFGQDKNTAYLHLQVYSEGICMPMSASNYYSTSKFHNTKSVLQSGAYYSTVNVYINSKDSGDLNPSSNHELRSSSIAFNPKLEYEMVITRIIGYHQPDPDSMVIKIPKLDSDAQVLFNFVEGSFRLEEMKYFKKIPLSPLPDFKRADREPYKNTLKLESTTYFSNGKTKAKYYIIGENFPLFYAVEYDSLNPSTFAQGFRFKPYDNAPFVAKNQPIWTTANTKYGYWDYYDNEQFVKHEMWAGVLQQVFEWYPSGQLKFCNYLEQSTTEKKQVRYLENGSIQEEFYLAKPYNQPQLKYYAYSPEGILLLISTFKSSNGISKDALIKRELFYPSGKLKMEENWVSTYAIKYYNEDGTERKM